MRNRLLFTVILLCTLLSSVYAQGNLKGRILDEHNLAMPGALIFIHGTSYGTSTSVDGYFRLIDLPEGQHEISISSIGYPIINRTVSIKHQETATITVTLLASQKLEEVVIRGNGYSQINALNQQKNDMKIMNVISADQVNRFPDANIGDAIKRVPGVYVQYDQGEARFANIRGTAPELNAVTINGERIPSAEAENRSVQLDLIPSDMVQAVEVAKAITPDMDADAIGGAVNLVTRSAPDAPRVAMTLGSGYNLIANKPMLNGAAVLGKRFFDNKLGVIVSASVFNHHLGSDNFEAEWEDDATLKEFQIRQYYLQRLRQSYSIGLDFKINENHTLFFKSMYNHRNDWENRMRTTYKLDGYNTEADAYAVKSITKETKGGLNNHNRRLEDQRVLNGALSGEHLVGSLHIDWSLSYSKASEHRPDERYMAYEYETDDLLKFSGSSRKPVPANFFYHINEEWALDEISNENQYTEEVDRGAKINFMLPIVKSGFYANELKFGAKLKVKSKYRNNDFMAYEPLDDQSFFATVKFKDFSKSNFLAGPYQMGNFVDPAFITSLKLNNSQLFEGEIDPEELAGNFDAEEAVAASYLMVNQNFGNKLSAVAGVRLEQTTLNYGGFAYDDEEETLTPTPKETDRYLNVLPSVHLKYSPNDQLNVRLAWTNTLARPNYFDLVPYRQIFPEDLELAIGNPALKPTLATNYDLMSEYYFQSIGLMSAGVFVKDITDYIVRKRFDQEINGETYDVMQPVNAGNAMIVGFEFGFQRQLNFLPAPFDGLSAFVNYTFTNSTTDNINLEDRKAEALPMVGTAKHAMNSSLVYDARKFSLGVSFNYTSSFISEIAESAFEDIYYDQVTYLDANANISLSKKTKLFIEVNNILNQPLRFFQGSESFTFQEEYYNMRCSMGLKINLY